jgi:hypothetical protein
MMIFKKNSSLLICLTILISGNVSAQITAAQRQLLFFPNRTGIQTEIPQPNCTTPQPSTNICNYFTNNNFTPTSSYVLNPANPNAGAIDPFYLDLVPNWLSAQGSPKLYDLVGFWTTATVAPPPPATGYASMAVEWQSNINLSSGIAQQIAPLQANSNYLLSFFIRTSAAQAPASPLNVNVVLMRCSDYGLISANAGSANPSITPPRPSISQPVFCQLEFNNTTAWEKKVVAFTTGNQVYDMVWIYAEGINNINPTGILDFAYPELIATRATNFTAGPSPNPQLPNCLVTIGPTNNNCGVNNASYRWVRPNGSYTPVSQSQQFLVDANVVSNVGVWTLQMIPSAGTINVNNICSILPPQTIASSTVNVPACAVPNCIILPTIK